MTRSLFSLAAALVAASMLAAPGSARAQDGLRLAPVPFSQQDARELKQTISHWQDGDPIPFGYHAERKPRIGLLVAGSLTFAIPYAIGAFSAANSESKEMFVPIVGPFITAVNQVNRPCSSTFFCGDGWKAFSGGVFAAVGIVQGVGAAMLIAGAVGKYTLVADEPGSVSVTPMYLPSGAGIGVSGQF
ncbi:MAG TPA: hypothetical protein VGK67_24970 [Myxococcales bacterium]|jgi:hypothetical protein